MQYCQSLDYNIVKASKVATKKFVFLNDLLIMAITEK
jgi:hypothetical protein